MANRYNQSKIFRDENGTQYLNRIEYPAIPIRDTDVLIRGVFGETFMNIAHRYYRNKDFWWVIARANNQGSSIYTVPGKEYRIPQNLNLILQEFQELNS